MTYFGALKFEETLIERHTIGPSGDYAPHVLSSYILGVFAPSRNGREQRIWEGIPAHSGGGWEGALPPMAPSRNGREQYGQWGGAGMVAILGKFRCSLPLREGAWEGAICQKGREWGGGAFLHV